MIFLGIFMIFLMILILAGILYERRYVCEEVFEETTTTEYPIVGKLHRHWDQGQPFVIDPADKIRTWVNNGDDLYEDNDGNIWELV